MPDLPFLEVLREHPYLFSFVVFLIEEAGAPLPLPADLLMLYAGWAHARLGLQAERYIALATLASIIGSNFLFWISSRWGPALIERWGRRLHLTPARLERARIFLDRHGLLAVFLGRLVPGLRIVVSLAAGSLHMRWLPFFCASTLAALVWWTFFWLLGAHVGAPAIRLLTQLATPTQLIMAAGLGGLGLVLWKRRRARRGRGTR